MIIRYLRIGVTAKCDVDNDEDVKPFVNHVLTSCLSDEAGRPSSFQAKHGILKRPRYVAKTLSKLVALAKFPPSA